MLAAGLLLETLLRRRSAALRHCVLAGAIGAAAAVVPLGFVLPAWEVSVPAATAPAHTRPLPAAPASVVIAADPDPRDTGKYDRASLLPAAWLAGFVAAAAMLLAGMARLKWIAFRAEHVRDRRWTLTTASVAKAYGLRRQIVLLQTDAPDLLATWGLVRPRVLLPSHAATWSDERIHVVLCHELAHIWRLDWLVQLFAEALRTVLWFNPLIWIACTRLRRASEMACDDAVLQRGVAPRAYAGHLLELARQCRRSRMPPLPAVPMARPSTLERRIADMLNSRLDRRTLSHRAMGIIAALLIAVTLPSAALRAGQNGPAPLSGSIYDATGAVLPGVDLTLEDATQAKWQTQTGATGRFDFAAVPAGRYVLAVSLPGFRPLRQQFELGARADWDRAITLQVGDVSESVTVRASRMAPPPQPSQPQFAEPVRVGGNIRVPRKLVDVRPVYPPSMRAAGRDGIVPIEAIIGRDGTVTSVRVLSAQVHPDFAIAAVDAVRQWRFSPVLLNGAPVEVVMTVKVDFRLADQ
jgi:TonB family protein